MEKEQKLLDAYNEGIYRKLATALQQLTVSASPAVGSDCMLQAALAKALLAEFGIQTRIVVGEAAWRLGPGNGDVMVHSPKVGGFAMANGPSLAFHAWLETAQGEILDFTTNSLRLKAQQLDALDGGKTTVEWCPPYLRAPRTKSSVWEVTQSFQSGVYHYGELPGLLELMQSNGLANEPAPEDLAILKMIYTMPAMQVVGVNDLHPA